MTSATEKGTEYVHLDIRKETAELLNRIRAARGIPKLEAVHEGVLLLAKQLNENGKGQV